MNGVYRANIGALDRIEKIQASLDRDGLHYTVEIGDDGWVTVRAHGTPKRRKRKPPKPPLAPGPPNLKQCERRLQQAQENLDDLRRGMARSLHQQWKPDLYTPDRDSLERKVRERHKHKRIGEAVARIIARHKSKDPYRHTKQDYTEMDAVCGQKVRRAGSLPAAFKTWLEYIVRTYAGSWRWDYPKTQSTSDASETRIVSRAVKEFLEAKLDVEYWIEMVNLCRS